ncbi:MAG: carbon-nitrogen hydrolase family protein [Spirochaetes bacterium]|nr:carbon-nitrogen hydrolase family protein [Spirochaetota bacterium]
MIRDADFALVQSRFLLSDYLTEENFSAKIDSLFSRVFSNKEKKPLLVVFPELTGLWIPILTNLFKRPGNREQTSDRINQIVQNPALAGIIFKNITRSPVKAFLSFIKGQRFSFVFYGNWKESYRIWITPFLKAAVRYNTYVCPGSIFVPPIDREVLQGLFAVSKGIYNTSLLINPKGKVVGVSRKVNITKDEKKLGIRGGRVEDLFPFSTEIGKVGILICLDGFYDSLAARMDNFGCEVVIQPSANPKKWKQEPRRDAEQTQEEEWLSSGIGKLVQGRESIVYALNPMSVSSVFGHADEGLSNAWVNSSLADSVYSMDSADSGYEGLLSIAENYDKEEIIYGRF